jgi:hypothetical protein
MNQSEINNLVTLLVAVLSPIVAKYGINNEQTSTVVGDVFSVAAIIWGIASHWNQIKVPETFIVTPPASK